MPNAEKKGSPSAAEIVTFNSELKVGDVFPWNVLPEGAKSKVFKFPNSTFIFHAGLTGIASRIVFSSARCLANGAAEHYVVLDKANRVIEIIVTDRTSNWARAWEMVNNRVRSAVDLPDSQ